MRERHSLLQRSHVCTVSGLSELSLCFLRALLSVAACDSFSSPDLRCVVRASLHLDRLAAWLSQDSVLMSTVFMSRFTTSRHRSCGLQNPVKSCYRVTQLNAISIFRPSGRSSRGSEIQTLKAAALFPL